MPRQAGAARRHLFGIERDVRLAASLSAPAFALETIALALLGGAFVRGL